MDTIVTMGLVLRETRYKEADRILTILTPELGVISASAPNSLRLKSKLFSACGLFCYSEFVLVPGRNMYTVREASVNTIFHGVSSSIEGMGLAMYLDEMAVSLSPTGTEAGKELRLLLNCLYMLSEQKRPVRMLKVIYELRSMTLAGYMPDVLACSGCGKYDGGEFYLDPIAGNLLCAACADKARHLPNLDEGALYALRHICLAEDKKLFSFTLSDSSLKDLSRVSEQYVLAHLEHKMKSLDFLKTVLE